MLRSEKRGGIRAWYSEPPSPLRVQKGKAQSAPRRACQSCHLGRLRLPPPSRARALPRLPSGEPPRPAPPPQLLVQIQSRSAPIGRAESQSPGGRIPPPAGFAGKLPYYCDAEKDEKPRARPGPARPSLARCQAASPAAGRRRSRCGVERGAGPGIVGWKAARGTPGGRRVPPGAAVSARLPRRESCRDGSGRSACRGRRWGWDWGWRAPGPGPRGHALARPLGATHPGAPATGTALRGAEGAARAPGAGPCDRGDSARSRPRGGAGRAAGGRACGPGSVVCGPRARGHTWDGRAWGPPSRALSRACACAGPPRKAGTGSPASCWRPARWCHPGRTLPLIAEPGAPRALHQATLSCFQTQGKEKWSKRRFFFFSLHFLNAGALGSGGGELDGAYFWTVPQILFLDPEGCSALLEAFNPIP